FIASADERFGSITTLRRDGHIVKHIPWSVFKLSELDWSRVRDAAAILADSNAIQQYFSPERQPTLWRALPAIEELQTAWEAKCNNPRYAIYKPAITDSLSKLNKYYSRFDEKPGFILTLGKLFVIRNPNPPESLLTQFTVLYAYYKLTYIKLVWGGEKEQAEERAAHQENYTYFIFANLSFSVLFVLCLYKVNFSF
ncbi:hypothetical protein DFH94DRAFT_640945, partial [Russula ochroleuca]